MIDLETVITFVARLFIVVAILTMLLFAHGCSLIDCDLRDNKCYPQRR